MPDLHEQLARLVDAAEPVALEEVTTPAFPVVARHRWRRPLVAGGLAAACALVLAVGVLALRADRRGVVDVVDTTTTTSPAPATSVPVTTPEPSTAPTTPAPPPGLDRNGLSTDGVGVLRFGATIAEAEAVTGSQAVVIGPDGCSSERVANLTYEGLRLSFLDGRFTAWIVDTTGWKTLSGVEVTMGTDAVLSRLPNLERFDGAASFLAFPPSPTNFALRIDGDDRVVEMIAASDRAIDLTTADEC